MKTEKNRYNYDYKIDTNALYREFKIVAYDLRDSIVLINVDNSYIYEEIASENIKLVQSILDSSRSTGIGVHYSSNARKAGLSNNRFGIPIVSGELICIVRDIDNKKCMFLSFYFNKSKIERIKVLHSFEKNKIPFIVSSLPYSYFNDVHVIKNKAIKAQLLGLLHPCFFIGETLYISIQTQSEKYSALQISKLLKIASDMLNEFCILDVNNINTSISLMSPGNVLLFLESSIKFIEDNWQGILLLYIILFGGSYTNGEFSIEAPSIRNFMFHILNYKREKRMKDFEMAQKELEVKKLRLEVEKLEKQNQEKDESIEDCGNNYTQSLGETEDDDDIDTTINYINNAIQNINEVASEINITIPDNELVDLNEIMSILETPIDEQ